MVDGWWFDEKYEIRNTKIQFVDSLFEGGLRGMLRNLKPETKETRNRTTPNPKHRTWSLNLILELELDPWTWTLHHDKPPQRKISRKKSYPRCYRMWRGGVFCKYIPSYFLPIARRGKHSIAYPFAGKGRFPYPVRIFIYLRKGNIPFAPIGFGDRVQYGPDHVVLPFPRSN